MMNKKIPIVVDLDGTLIRSDLLYEAIISLFKSNFIFIFILPFVALKGHVFLKSYIFSRFSFDPKILPYNTEVLDWLKYQKKKKRILILCTGTHECAASKIYNYLDLFDFLVASSDNLNLVGKAKAKTLIDLFDVGNFDYIGNSFKDLTVWRQARHALIVSSNHILINALSHLKPIEKIFRGRTQVEIFISFLISLRMHQWLKNTLLFVPLIAAHQFEVHGNYISLCLAFIAFSFCASSVYIVNDLFDLESDRMHSRKCERPFASGYLPAYYGIIILPFLILVYFISINIGENFLRWIELYFFISCIYSWTLKKIILVDCLTLAILYTLRIIAGAAAITVPLSFWLFVFSVFLFLSLAFLKRYAEMKAKPTNSDSRLSGRAYLISDSSFLQNLGINSGFISVLVLALYLNSENVLNLYKAPYFLWGALIVILFWINWIWMQANRGKMHDDPVVFAIKDNVSIFSGVIFALFIWLGTVGF